MRFSVSAAAGNSLIQQMLFFPTVTSSQCNWWISDRLTNINEYIWMLDGLLIRFEEMSCLFYSQLLIVWRWRRRSAVQNLFNGKSRPLWPLQVHWSMLHKQDKHWLLIAPFWWSLFFFSIMVQVWEFRILEIIRGPNKTQNWVEAVFKSRGNGKVPRVLEISMLYRVIWQKVVS